jgi:long-chain fatty acid transport protein
MEAEGGEATFSNIPNSPLTPFRNTTFNAALPLPAEVSLGVSYQFREKWLFAFDVNQTMWSVYDSLDLQFADPNIPDSENARNYKDASIYRFGLQYAASDLFTLRAGYYFDESPVQDGYFAPETPRNDSHGFTGGLSLNVSEKLSIDAAFLYIRFEEVEASYDHYFENGQAAPFGGRYKSSAFIPGLGISYRL